MKRFKEKTIITPTGESFPLLVNSDTGIPDINSTLFILTQVRSKGKAAATIKYTLRNISFFKLILEKYDMSEDFLVKRFEEGRIFHPYELEGIIEDCKFKIEDIINDIKSAKDNELPLTKKFSLKSLEKFRSKNSFDKRSFVDKASAGNRLRTIRNYVLWLVEVYLSRSKINSFNFLTLKDNTKDFKEKIEARIPPKSSNSLIDGKEGLSEEEMKTLLDLINRKSENNPFRGEFLRSRNEVIFVWLIKFGIRKGELLNIKISDIDFRKKQVLILRRADDIADPRINKPNVKTKSRILAIPDKIMEITEHYILDHRSKIRGAKKNEYLIVSSANGDPLSLEAIAVMFRRLRQKFPALPEDFTAHTLRHTWNDDFSKLMDKKGIPEEREQQIRNYQMGWRDGSKMAENYTKRHTREKANEVINEMAEKLFKNSEDFK
ncbi:tyrosine-type recombinase/integrase [Aliarcobacter butzleri]|uniref:tyrosine-type recombinase/integrase n=1 Tax=Aliarcobacter butzleri TaxID=28197 RepID=UPI00263C0CB0|nr:tyrosine-type recombinase/integrase [Aliarcobacter butzleri]MDN5058247.1 tyrosine-type recombinase/integrase [Aliarcobacter butzleri]